MINDIFFPHSKSLFILESPHTSEIASGVPLSGESGLVFSRVFFGKHDEPAGKVISSGETDFALLNTFQYALQMNFAGNPLRELGSSIQSLTYKNRLQYSSNLQGLFAEFFDDSDVDIYLSRIRNAMAASSINKIIVCGSISQSFFEYAMKIDAQKFGSEFPIIFDKRKIMGFYTWHPSPRSGRNVDKFGKKISAWEDAANQALVNRMVSFAKTSRSR